MRRILLAAALLAAGGALLWAQREWVTVQKNPRLEVYSVFPRETSPGFYEQVDQRMLQQLSDQGWELVSVMPYVYRNEERGPAMPGPKAVVTQTYPAYFFKRARGGAEPVTA